MCLASVLASYNDDDDDDDDGDDGYVPIGGNCSSARGHGEE